MDAAGKDGTIKHLMSGVNPQGVDVFSFKSPSSEELSHDFLWRTNGCLPPRGKIGIFKERIPAELRGKHFWRHRYDDINAFELYLARNGIAIRKFFLNVSRREQKRRLLERLADPRKRWKFSAADLHERSYWSDYRDAYEKMICNTAWEYAPWVVVPADNKWFTRLIVVATIVDALASLDLKYPQLSDTELKELQKARKRLEKRVAGQSVLTVTSENQ